MYGTPVILTTLQPSCTDCPKILGASTSWSLKVLYGVKVFIYQLVQNRVALREF